MHFTFIRNSDIDIAIFCKYRIEASLLGADASPAGASGTQIQPFGFWTPRPKHCYADDIVIPP